MQVLAARPLRSISLSANSRCRRHSLGATAQLPGKPNIEQPWERRKGSTDPTLEGRTDGRSAAPAGRKWWDYAAPTGAVGRPDIQQQPVTIPPLGPDGGSGGGSGGSSGRSGGGGNGGRGGNGGGGNGGSGGSWMRGPTYLFAIALLLGGLMAYFRRGSQKSLLFSAAAAIMLLVAASLLHHRSGVLLALGTSLVLAGAMGQRANRSGKVFPAGIVALVSALMTIGYAKALA